MIYRTIGLVVIVVVLVTSVYAQVPRINVGLSVTGYIGGPSQTQDWHYEATEPQALSLIINRTSGELDPLVTVLAPGGQQIDNNDDRYEGLILDAGIDSLNFNATGIYTIRIGSLRGAGDYRLWVVPGPMHVWEAETFDGNAARWSGAFSYAQAHQLILSTAQLVGRSVYVSPEGIIPISDYYLQAEFEWVSGGTNSSLGLVVRANDSGSGLPEGYYFTISPNQTWMVQKRQFGAFEELHPPTTSPELLAQEVALGVHATGTELHFYANGILLTEINDSTFTNGTWGLYLYGEGIPGMASVDNLLLTVPTLSPPPAYPDALENWQSGRPADVAAELAEANVIPADGQRVYTVLETNYQGPPRLMRSYPQSPEDASYANLMVGVDVNFEEGDNLGCGLALRRVDDSNQIVAYADLDGGVGLVDIQDGILRHNTYDLLSETNFTGTRLILIAHDEWVTLYANGRYFDTHFVPPRTGNVGVTVVNYSTGIGRCAYRNLWIWN